MNTLLSNKCNLSVKGGILRVIDGLAPLVACAFFRHGNGNVRKPLVFDGAMPMFDFGRNIHHIARLQTPCRFAGFLIPAFACRANQDLTRAVVDMPVVATGGGEGDVMHGGIARSERGEITVASEILGVSSVFLALGEDLLEGHGIPDVGSGFIVRRLDCVSPLAYYLVYRAENSELPTVRAFRDWLWRAGAA